MADNDDLDQVLLALENGARGYIPTSVGIAVCAEAIALAIFSASVAAIVDEYGKLKPIASIAADIVLAVYIPPHDPAPGHARRSMSSK